MKKSNKIVLIQILFLSIIVSCNTNPIAKVQGVFEVNKDSLKVVLQKEMEGESAFAMGMFNVAIENAVIEFDIKGDSIFGIIFLAGETTLLDSKIIVRNDTLVINTSDNEAYLFPTETGLSYLAKGAKITLELIKTEKEQLDEETRDAIEAQKQAILEKEEFEKNLGKWQEGYYVDEFGDKTGEGFAYSLMRGTHENSISTTSEVFVKATVENNKLSFQIYNSSFGMKEIFPDSEFGKMKFKSPDGSIKSERVFFYENSFIESDEEAYLFDYISNNDGIVKVYIDLSTASEYYSDKYQFTIEQNNLTEILAGLMK